MAAVRKGNVDICVATIPGGRTISCKDCGTVLGSGYFAVGIAIGERRYLAEHNPPLKCCGKYRAVPFLYGDYAGAESKVRQVGAIVSKDGQDRKSTRLNSSHQIISYA